ncbi:hypothetical protein J7L67_04385 [bacterium]|nr:hypothetical protein [bacterium]
MRYLSLPVLKKYNDSLIRNNLFLLFNALIFVIFFLFFLIDIFSSDQAENYHRASRIFFPAEFTRRLILYQTISCLFVLPFMLVFALKVRNFQKDGLSAFFAGYKPLHLVVEKLLAVVIPCFFMITIFTVISIISVKINHDITFSTVILAQLILFIMIVLYTSICCFITGCIKSTEMSLLVAAGVLVLSVAGIYLIGGLAGSITNPQHLINFMLSVNPVVIVSSVLKYDVMRSWFLYHSAQVVMFRFDYPDVINIVLYCCGITFLLILFSSVCYNRLIIKKISAEIFKDYPASMSGNNIDEKDFLGKVVLLSSKNNQDTSQFFNLFLKKIFFIKNNRFGTLFYRVGYCSFYHDVFDDDDTVKASLYYNASLYGVLGDKRKKRITDITRQFGLNSLLNIKIKKLSLSQRLLLRMACSVLHNPNIIIIDEIFDHLNSFDRNTALQFAENLHNDKKSVIISTQLTGYLLEKKFINRIIAVSSAKITLNLNFQQITEKILMDALNK